MLGQRATMHGRAEKNKRPGSPTGAARATKEDQGTHCKRSIPASASAQPKGIPQSTFKNTNEGEISLDVGGPPLEQPLTRPQPHPQQNTQHSPAQDTHQHTNAHCIWTSNPRGGSGRHTQGAGEPLWWQCKGGACTTADFSDGHFTAQQQPEDPIPHAGPPALHTRDQHSRQHLVGSEPHV